MDFSRKCTALLLVVCLMFSNIGLALNVHFCGDKKISSQLIYAEHSATDLCDHLEDETHHHQDDSCCSKGKSHKDCCKDEILTQDYSEVIITPFYFTFQAVLFEPMTFTPQYFALEKRVATPNYKYTYTSNDPPFYQLYCSRLFYA